MTSVDFRNIINFTWNRTYSPLKHQQSSKPDFERIKHDLREVVLQEALAPAGKTTYVVKTKFCVEFSS